MKMFNDEGYVHLSSFGFVCEEHTTQGFIRYSKKIGNMIVTIANGQFGNKIRISLWQDKDGNAQVSYRDILAYADMLCAIQEAGLICCDMDIGGKDTSRELQENPLDNPLIAFPRKPDGFMV